MNAGDITFERLTKSRQRIFHVVDLSVYDGPVPHPNPGDNLYKDIVGLIRRLKTDRRSAASRTLPEYTYEVHLEKEPIRRFYDEDEAKAWVIAVLRMS